MDRKTAKELGEVLPGLLLIFFLVVAPFVAIFSAEAGWVSLAAACIVLLMLAKGQ